MARIESLPSSIAANVNASLRPRQSMQPSDSRLASLSDEQKRMVFGSPLSQRFATWPLGLSHPAIVSAFYGLLLSATLVLPIGMHNGWEVDSWFREVAFRTLMIAVGLAIVGQFSAIVQMISKRPPITPPRAAIYIMPFIGFILLLSIWTGMMDIIPITIAWLLMLAPGPIYVHFSWAPRHRMLVMLEDGKDPFVETIVVQAQREMERELEDAVNSLEQ